MILLIVPEYFLLREHVLAIGSFGLQFTRSKSPEVEVCVFSYDRPFKPISSATLIDLILP